MPKAYSKCGLRELKKVCLELILDFNDEHSGVEIGQRLMLVVKELRKRGWEVDGDGKFKKI